jgi:hypothetical protein
MLDDQGLNRIYDIEKNGRIVAIKTDTIHLPPVPVCHCGAAVSAVRRYTVIEQLRAALGNFDRLIAKVGRKLKMFGDRVHEQETLLADTFDVFCHNIRPLPLAAAHNKECVFGRGTAIIDIQNTIVSFRGKCNFRGQCMFVGSGCEFLLMGEGVNMILPSIEGLRLVILSTTLSVARSCRKANVVY